MQLRKCITTLVVCPLCYLCAFSDPHQLRRTHLDWVLLHGPAGCIKYHHLPITQRAPQFRVPTAVRARHTQLPCNQKRQHSQPYQQTPHVLVNKALFCTTTKNNPMYYPVHCTSVKFTNMNFCNWKAVLHTGFAAYMCSCKNKVVYFKHT